MKVKNKVKGWIICTLVLLVLVCSADAVDSELAAGCDLEFGSDFEPKGSANIAVWDGDSYETSVLPQWRCRPTNTDCPATKQSNDNAIYRITNNGSISGCLDISTDTAAPAGMDFKCGITNVAGGATIITDSAQQIQSDIAVGGATDIWCWIDMDNPTSGWVFDLIAKYVS